MSLSHNSTSPTRKLKQWLAIMSCWNEAKFLNGFSIKLTGVCTDLLFLLLSYFFSFDVDFPGRTISFRLHSSLVGCNAKVFCNYPKSTKDSKEVKFLRHHYYELPWIYEGNESTLREVDGYAQIEVSFSGSFRFYCAVAESGYKDEVCSGYFVVDPLIHVPLFDANNKPTGDETEVRLDAVCMQTVVTKHLGPVEEWKSRLRTSKESGYNMIHFTPVQHLGASNSAYSIKDQLKVHRSQILTRIFRFVDIRCRVT